MLKYVLHVRRVSIKFTTVPISRRDLASYPCASFIHSVFSTELLRRISLSPKGILLCFLKYS